MEMVREMARLAAQVMEMETAMESGMDADLEKAGFVSITSTFQNMKMTLTAGSVLKF
jgi:hypothetical protein